MGPWGLDHHLPPVTLDSWVSLALCLNLLILFGRRGSELAPTSPSRILPNILPTPNQVECPGLVVSQV